MRNLKEAIVMAFKSFGHYKLRTALTLLSIAIGVFAIMGSGTLVNSIDNAVKNEMANLGDNSFKFKKFPDITIGSSWHKYWKRKAITYSQAKELKKNLTLAQFVSVESASRQHTIKAGNLSTDSDVKIIGCDENFFIMNNVNIEKGRAFTEEDIQFNRNVAIIGKDVEIKIFPDINPIGQKIYIKHQAFTVIGLLEQRGAILGQSQDNIVLIPVTQFLKYYATYWEESLNIIVRVESKDKLVPAMDEAIGLMRTIRNDKPWEENSFEVITSETISDQFSVFTTTLSLFGGFSGFIALLAAGVGIMNIMLVSVKERTREIGIRKAVGAKNRWILNQFIIEAIVLCQVGGVIGIILGYFSANFLGNLLNVNIIFPIFWVIFSLIICTFIGFIFGAYPAWKAAKLDPIDALRYE